MIHVLAIITAKPGQRDSVVRIFNANVAAVHAEAGCIEYCATVDIDGADPAFGPDTFVAVEKWESLAALKAHAVARTWLHTDRRQKTWWPSAPFMSSRPPERPMSGAKPILGTVPPEV